mmetsp:Transcript_58911/g.97385  ORF Transcript_58911/g.97385 Transcript_58911/m.97385 type:complete len:91 (+) Transcript_58911:144-416(+)
MKFVRQRFNLLLGKRHSKGGGNALLECCQPDRNYSFNKLRNVITRTATCATPCYVSSCGCEDECDDEVTLICRDLNKKKSGMGLKILGLG